MAYNKIIYKGDILIDLTKDTVTPETLLEGVTAHAKNGEVITGTATGGAGGSANLIEGIFTKNGVYEPTVERIAVGNTVSFKDTYTAEEIKTCGDSVGYNEGVALLFFSEKYGYVCAVTEASNDNNYCIDYITFESGEHKVYCYCVDYQTYLWRGFGGNIIEEEFTPGWYFMADEGGKKVEAPSIALESAEIVETLNAVNYLFDTTPSDGWNKVTVNVPCPLGEWLTYTTPDGAKFYYSYSEDGRDMYVLGKGYITSTDSDFYCQEIPWNKDPRSRNLVRVIIGSDATYAWYAFHNCSGQKISIDNM